MSAIGFIGTMLKALIEYRKNKLRQKDLLCKPETAL